MSQLPLPAFGDADIGGPDVGGAAFGEPAYGEPACGESPPEASANSHAHSSSSQQQQEQPSEDDAYLDASLEVALSRKLIETYRVINASLFKGSLRQAVLKVSNTRSFLGRWDSHLRTIELSRSMVVHHAWAIVMEVLKHEMAHQYVDEVLGEPAAGHGTAFRRICERYKIDPKASGLPEDKGGGSAEEEKILTRLSRLLALADSPNENEAHAAASAAQRLMLRYNIDRVGVAASDRRYGFRQLGRISARVPESERLLASLLVSCFFVDAIWIHGYDPRTGCSGTALEICGTPANLEMASYVYDYLMRTAQALWEAHKTATKTSANRDRQTFLAGVMLGFQERLEREKKAHAGEGLVWVSDGELESYLRARHPHVRQVRRSGNCRNSAREHGKNAGRELILRKPIDAPSRDHGRLLPSKTR